jgi:hypothetical protein
MFSKLALVGNEISDAAVFEAELSKLYHKHTHFTTFPAVNEGSRYDVNMTKSKPTHNDSRSSAQWKDFLQLPNRNRAARLLRPPPMPRPREALLHDGFLKWTWYDMDGASKSPELQTAPATLCFKFARLAQASEEQIRVFAESWGPLKLDSRQEESVATWRQYARLAQALLRFTAQLNSGGPGDEEDWGVICESTPMKALERGSWSPELQMAVAAAAVNTWFAQARGHGILTMLNNDLQVRPYASNLFGVLVTQIAHVIARSDQKAVCAGCRNAFRPTRPIVRGSRQYCDVCRKKGVPQRDASRDWRRRLRKGRTGADSTSTLARIQNSIRSSLTWRFWLAAELWSLRFSSRLVALLGRYCPSVVSSPKRSFGGPEGFLTDSFSAPP